MLRVGFTCQIMQSSVQRRLVKLMRKDPDLESVAKCIINKTGSSSRASRKVMNR